MALIFITALLLALYWRTMGYRYLIDDNVRRWGYLLDVPEVSPPIHFYQVAKPSWWRHFFLTITHILNTIVIYHIWGWQPAFLFAVFPLSVSCTAWITGGYYQVTTFLTLTAFYFIFHWPGVIGSALGAVFFTAALGSTINCLTVPFMFFLFPPMSGLFLFWPLGFYLFGHRFGIGFRKRDAGKADHIHWRKIAVVTRVMAYYLWIALYPRKLAFFREFGFLYMRSEKGREEMESFNKDFWVSLALLITFAVCGWMIHPFGTAWFFVTLLPFSQWKVLGQFVAERYLYLPNVGIMLVVAKATYTIHPILFWAVFLVYLYRSHKYIPAFKDVFSLYSYGIKQFPNCVSNYVNLSEQELHRGNFIIAGQLLNKGLEIDPKSFLCHANLSAFWLAVKDWDKALQSCELALQTCEKRGMAYRVFSEQRRNIDNVKKQAEEMKRKDLERAKQLEEERLKSMEVPDESVAEIVPT